MLKKKFITGLWVLAAFCMLPAMPAMADETDTETPAKIIYMEEEEAAEPETAAVEAIKNTDTSIIYSSTGKEPEKDTSESTKENVIEAADSSSAEEAAEEYSPFTMGQRIAQFALQFTGRPYVYGGSSLTNGTDCSGFTMSVFSHFGISLPHSSASQRSLGTSVGSLENAQPGDLICYSGHVGLYIGDGQIVHASNRRNGIIVSSATHKRILAIRRVV